MNWRESVELHDRLRHWLRGRPAQTFFEHWQARRIESAEGRRYFARFESQKADRATLYWISDEMVTLAIHAAKLMPNQPFHESDLPSPDGLCLFETARPSPDSHGRTVNVCAYLWGAMTEANPPGAQWTLYSDVEGPSDYAERDLGDIGTRLLPLHVEAQQFESAIVDDGQVADLAELHSQEIVDSAVLWQRKLPLALWTLIQQPIAVVSETKLPREIRRRNDKAGTPCAVDTVRLVTLRRTRGDASSDPGESAEYSHRWIVSGHWRNQWLPSKQAHRLQWIHSFVKGPDGAPLVVKKTVHQLIR